MLWVVAVTIAGIVGNVNSLVCRTVLAAVAVLLAGRYHVVVE